MLVITLDTTCGNLLRNKSNLEENRVNLRKRLWEILFEHLDSTILDLFRDTSFWLAVRFF